MRQILFNARNFSAKFILLLFFVSAQQWAYAIKDENTVVFQSGWFKPATGTVLTIRFAMQLIYRLILIHLVFSRIQNRCALCGGNGFFAY
jgi:hypothetical protein